MEVDRPINYISKFDKKTRVYLVDESFSGYDALKSKFKIHGLGFAVSESKVIFIDLEQIAKENLTEHHITFIESHEIAHINLNHDKNFDKDQESEADYVGILLCKKHKETSAMKIGISNFMNRNKISFKKYHKQNELRFKNKKEVNKLL